MQEYSGHRSLRLTEEFQRATPGNRGQNENVTYVSSPLQNLDKLPAIARDPII